MDADQTGPIARKLLKRVRSHLAKCDYDIADLIAGTRRAEALQKTVANNRTLADFDPAHAIYVYAQNQVSMLSEQITIFLAGLPDVEKNRPHSHANR